MPTHIHLLIKPAKNTSLSAIMHWIKTVSAKRWNFIHGSIDHLWGSRYFARAIKDPQEYEFVMQYINQNPVKAELAFAPEEWKASGAFYKSRNISGLVDFTPNANLKQTKLLPQIPCFVSKLIPPAQLEHILRYIGVYAVALDKLFELLPKIPKIGVTQTIQEPPAYLYYFTNTHDFLIYEYDGEDTMSGKVRTDVYPAETQWQKFSLSKLMKNQFLKLEVSTAAFSRHSPR